MKIDTVASAIGKNRVLNKIIYFNSLDSTNKYLTENDFASGTIAAAAIQTAGRGRRGAGWVSGKGGLWFSFVINKKIINPYMFVVLSSVAVVETLAKYGLKPVIKWPNDILLQSSKICGILIENDAFNARIVTGIGVNVNNEPPQGLNQPVISVKKAVKRKINEEEFFIRLVKKLDSYLYNIKGLKKELINKWVRNQADITGREVSVIRNKKRISGEVKTVHKDGSVSIADRQGRIHKIKGEVFFLM
jgi:BirA family biotin operon repressor/biotin-[acetyl-CoA-carboxylase] ligase